MLIITGELEVKAGCLDELLEISFEQVTNSLSEAGCISYSFNEDKMNPGRFLFLERWKSDEAIELHFSKPYCLKFIGRIPHLIEGKPKIEIHEIADTRNI